VECSLALAADSVEKKKRKTRFWRGVHLNVKGLHRPLDLGMLGAIGPRELSFDGAFYEFLLATRFEAFSS
jgi:hypothetical protein